MKGRQGHCSAPSARDVHPHLLSNTEQLHSQHLHPPPSCSSRAQLCPFPVQEEDGGVSQEKPNISARRNVSSICRTFQGLSEKKNNRGKRYPNFVRPSHYKRPSSSFAEVKKLKSKKNFQSQPQRKFVWFWFQKLLCSSKNISQLHF